MAMSKSDLEMIFRAADYDGDGVISPELIIVIVILYHIYIHTYIHTYT